MVKRRLYIWKIQGVAIFISFDTICTWVILAFLSFVVQLIHWSFAFDSQTTERIQAIVLNPYEWERGYWNFEDFLEAFSKMYNLRLLKIHSVHIPNGLNLVSNTLKFLQWIGYSSKSLPSSFQPKELVELNLQSSKIKYLWEGVKVILFIKLPFYYYYFFWVKSTTTSFSSSSSYYHHYYYYYFFSLGVASMHSPPIWDFEFPPFNYWISLY